MKSSVRIGALAVALATAIACSSTNPNPVDDSLDPETSSSGGDDSTATPAATGVPSTVTPAATSTSSATATSARPPAETTAATPAPSGVPVRLVVIPMRLEVTAAAATAGAQQPPPFELQANGNLVRAGQTVMRVEGGAVKDPQGNTVIEIRPDGSVITQGQRRATMSPEGVLSLESSGNRLRFSIGEDGVPVQQMTPASGPAQSESIPLRWTGITPESRATASILTFLLIMLDAQQQQQQQGGGAGGAAPAGGATGPAPRR